MIIYDLMCSDQHPFEGWFKDSEDYARQLASGLLVCPVCATSDIKKSPSFSKISKSSSITSTKSPDCSTSSDNIHAHIEQNFEDVGRRFCDEALKIHYGEARARNICGDATLSEINDLRETGVELVALPPRPLDKNTLN